MGRKQIAVILVCCLVATTAALQIAEKIKVKNTTLNSTDHDVINVREKRGALATIGTTLLTSVVKFLFDEIKNYFTTGFDAPELEPPPKLECHLVEFYLGPNEDTMKIQFTVNADDYRKVILEGDGVPGGMARMGSNLWESREEVKKGVYSGFFLALGKDAETRCTAVRRVIEINCGPVPPLKLGYPKTTSQTTFGSIAFYECIQGYHPDIRASTCVRKGDSGVWDPKPGPCSVKRCPGPIIDPENGETICYGSEAEPTFGAICKFKCNDGFSIQPGVKRMIYCRHNGTWDSSVPQCVDADPPILQHCPEDIMEYLEPGTKSMKVIFNLPRYQDNSGHYDLVLVQGQESGSLFDIGNHRIIYTATDRAGNNGRTCMFTIDIRAKRCPRFDVTAMDKNLLQPDCDMDNILGSVCTFQCKGNLPLGGAMRSVCQNPNDETIGVWTHNTRNPFCEVKSCPDLEAPRNGDLQCDGWSYGKLCYPTCPNNLQFSTKPDDFYACGPLKGMWRPKDTIPDCIDSTEGSVKNEQEFEFEFSGDCEDPDVMAHILEGFEDILEQRIKKMPKPNGQALSGSTQNITCIQHSERQRRNTHGKVRIKFEITIKDEITGESAKSTPSMLNYLDAVDSTLVSLAKGGLLNVETPSGDRLSVIPEAVHRVEPTIQCEAGFIPNGIQGCVACGYGTFYSAITQVCLPCPKGGYQYWTGQPSCTPCPDGYSTTGEGAQSRDECMDMCKLGTSSRTGVQPCIPCDIGSYQNEAGQSMCKTCPSGMLTEEEGTQNISSCRAVDIHANSRQSIIVTNPLLPNTKDLTLLMKVKLTDPNTDQCILVSTIENPGNKKILELVVSNGFRIKLEGQEFHADVTFDPRFWVTVQLYLSSKMSKIFLMINDELVLEESARIPDIENTLETTLMKNCNGRITNVNMWGDNMTSDSMNDDCYNPAHGDILSWDDVIRDPAHSQLTRVPSNCRDLDLCTPNPCQNNGTCLENNEGSDYQCHCPDLYQGHHCEVKVTFCTNDSCVNGGECVEGLDNFTCNCVAGFVGFNCDLEIVNGGWGEWSEWASCSKTCGPGARDKTRWCNAPAPMNGGSSCTGVGSMTEKCNLGDCKNCSPLLPPLNGTMSCGVINGTTVCNTSCDPWFFYARIVPDIYSCGPESDFMWTDQEPGTNEMQIPKCSELQVPSKIVLQYEVEYSNTICRHGNNMSGAILDKSRTIANQIPCVESRNCSFTTKLSPCGASQSPKVMIEVERDITEVNDISELTEEVLKNFVTSVQELEEAGQMISNKSTSGGFDVEVDGTILSVNPEKSFFQGKYDCKGGMRKDNICVKCGTGQYKKENTCLSCKRGTYQPEKGQDSCISCPVGMTTETIEAVSKDQCKIKCDAGHYKVENTCIPCKIGQFQPQTDQRSCTPCPGGMTTKAPGASSIEDCNEFLIPDIDSNDKVSDDHDQDYENNYIGTKHQVPAAKVKGLDIGTIIGSLFGMLIFIGIVVIVIVAMVLIWKRKHQKPLAQRIWVPKDTHFNTNPGECNTMMEPTNHYEEIEFCATKAIPKDQDAKLTTKPLMKDEEMFSITELQNKVNDRRENIYS